MEPEYLDRRFSHHPILIDFPGERRVIHDALKRVAIAIPAANRRVIAAPHHATGMKALAISVSGGVSLNRNACKSADGLVLI